MRHAKGLQTSIPEQITHCHYYPKAFPTAFAGLMSSQKEKKPQHSNEKKKKWEETYPFSRELKY